MGWVTKTNKPTGTGNLELTDKIMTLYRNHDMNLKFREFYPLVFFFLQIWKILQLFSISSRNQTHYVSTFKMLQYGMQLFLDKTNIN
jgi:hypothetical protein